MTHSTYHSSTDLVHRRAFRERLSVSELSAEAVQTLPEYSSPPGWSNSVCPPPPTEVESDRPPDYPETADEDADTEGDQEETIVYVQHHLVHPSPRRSLAHIRRRKRAPSVAASDPFLDTLLERSVHALEMSNALLRTTMSTQSSLSTLFSSENEPDHVLEVRARNLSTRIRVSSGIHETWMDHLEEISEGVDKLFGDESRSHSASHSDGGAVSQSLPTTTLPDLRHRRKPSILDLDRSSSSHLLYSLPTRDVLVAPAPRALTQYVESTADPQLITLPSTLGLRASGSSHSVHSRESSSTHLQVAQPPSAVRVLPESQPEDTTPAYHLLSNLVKRSGSLTPPSSARLLRSRDRRASTSPRGTLRGTIPSFSPPSVRALFSSPDRSRSAIQTQTLRSRLEMPGRSSTPPNSFPTMLADEDLSPSSSEASDRPTGYRTVQSLRKILDNHPSSVSVNTLQRKGPKLHRAPTFLPITPPPAPIQGTSTATASISRLYTKGRHSMSTRPPSPPTHSSLKVRSVPPTPAPSPSTVSLSEAFGNGVARVMGSVPSSGMSTPKRISFAELPESYSSSQPGMSKLRWRKGRKKKQGKGNDKEETSGWLETLLRGGLSSGGLAGMGSREERIEERMARGWGSRPGYGTLDDWAV
ncbi:hypothetical protein HD554DRAFT_2050200 [Boletus coccyginus]|nr:hypothetical protein HD554DRAFT_2050200 [Boletus coccyginus]